MKQLSKLKVKNISSVLHSIRDNSNISKKNLSVMLGLSSPLLTNICNELKEKSLIFEGSTLPSNKAGRPEVALNFNYNLKKIIGINISSEFTTIIISNLFPSIIFEEKIETKFDNSQKFLEILKDIISLYLSNNNLTTSDFLGIGISSKGTTNIEEGIIGEDFFHEKIKIREYLSNYFNIPIFIENDVKVLAITQNFFFPNDDNFFLVKYSIHGIGGALFKDGKLYTNKNNSVGKIGHVIIDLNEEFCPICKRKGCLETCISLKRIFSDLKKEIEKKEDYILVKTFKDKDINIENLFSAFENGSISINKLLRKSASYLAQALINTSAINGTNKVILYGDFFLQDSYLFLLKQYLQEYELSPFWRNVSVSTLTLEQEKLASCVLVIKKVFYDNFETYYNFL